MPDRLVVSNEGPVRILRIQRPEVRNAVDSKLAKALRDAWLAFDKDPEAKVGILTGGDEVFCAGADLADLDGLAAEVEGDHGPLGFSRLSVSKPVLAAVAGYCVGGGLELACWCDIRVADTTAVFGCFERRFGVPLIDGGTQRLPRIVGLGRALEIILTGRPIRAEEARAMGLVNEIVPPGQALRRAMEVAQQIAAFPQLCVKSDRQAVYEGLGNRLEKGLRIEARLGAEVLRSGEPAAGAKDFKKGKGRGGTFK
jgi:enoyl-CoA hydratase